MEFPWSCDTLPMPETVSLEMHFFPIHLSLAFLNFTGIQVNEVVPEYCTSVHHADICVQVIGIIKVNNR